MIVHPGNYEPLTAFDSSTGAVKWTPGGAGFFASPVGATLGGTRQVISAAQDSIIAVVQTGDLLLLLNDDAELIVAKASRTGFEPVVRYTVADSATWAQPTISGNRIFIKDVASLSRWTVDEG